MWCSPAHTPYSCVQKFPASLFRVIVVVCGPPRNGNASAAGRSLPIFFPTFPPVAQVMHYMNSAAEHPSPRIPTSDKRRSRSALQAAQKRCAHAAAGATRGNQLAVAAFCQKTRFAQTWMWIAMRTRPARLFASEAALPPARGLVDSRTRGLTDSQTRVFPTRLHLTRSRFWPTGHRSGSTSLGPRWTNVW
ncbi:hypothetical protein M433DRAFT_384558 [Acidomyces richmondensis BFW]|nr:MAG: hypothetical protein FE78DRAFT_523956 [Acidomyces sp. 'richmondensis']KYG42888.1 hypothetical protein M433DRAFT_384558 [Acidomyces richmondensis BFW]